MTTKRNICLLNCEDDPHWVEYYVNLLGDAFNVIPFTAFKLQWPDKTQFDTFDGFVITGSISSAHETEEQVPGTWVPKFGQYVKTLFDYVLDHNKHSSQKKRLLGVCFGHQIIAHYCGGQSHKMSAAQYGLQPQTIQKVYAYVHSFLIIYNFHFPA